MEDISSLLKNKHYDLSVDQLTVENKYFNTSTDQLNQLTTESKSVDKLLANYSELINETFKPWYAKRAMQLGCAKFTELAERSKKYGTDPAKLFSYLLKQ